MFSQADFTLPFMFSIFSRSIPRKTVVQSVRYFAQKPPSQPGLPKKKVKSAVESNAEPNQETKSRLESETSTSRTEEPLVNQELEGTTPKSGVPTLDFSPPEFEKEFQRTGARSSKDSLSTNERKRRFMSRVSLALLALAFGASTVYMGREWEEDELKAKKMVRVTLLQASPCIS